MSYLVYARRFRPRRFDEVVGQKAVVNTLTNALAQGHVGHAYLFCGPRGVGKTTTARILAKALNCQKGPTPEPCEECPTCREFAEGRLLDVIEMDAATHTGVDDVRELREEAGHVTHRARFRVYIIDEVHMLSTAAFNAFLKLLEEPPAHVKFILCTTDPQKVPGTVRSRCQRLDFRLVTIPDVVARLRQIAQSEGIAIAEAALSEIARHAEGGLRDAEVLLERVALGIGREPAAEITAADVREHTGAVDESKLASMVAALAGSRAKDALEEADAIVEAGTDPGELIDALTAHLRAALAVQACGADAALVRARGFDVDAAASTARALAQEDLLYAAAILQAARKETRVSTQPRVVLELALVRLSRVKDLVSLEEIAAGVGNDGYSLRPAAVEAVSPPAGRRTPARQAPSEPQAEAGEIGPPPAAPDGDLTVGNVSERWPWVLARTAERSKPVGALLREGKVAGVKGNAVVVSFASNYSFHRESLSSPDRLSLAEEVASEVFGRPVSLRLEADKGGPGAKRRPEARRETPQEAALRDPVIQKVVERFDGRVVHVDDADDPGAAG